MQVFKRTMKKMGRPALFLAILAVMLLGLSAWLTQVLKDNDSFLRSRNGNIVRIQREPEGSMDVLVLGDSLSYTAISPMQLWAEQGIAAYDGGQSGQTIQETYYMLKTALRTQKPKVLLLETNVLFHGEKGIDGAKEAIAQFARYYLPVFQYHDSWKSILLGEKHEDKCYKGFIIRTKAQPYNTKKYRKRMKKTQRKKEMSESALLYLDMILGLCKENGIEAALVSTPSPVNCTYEKHNTLEEYANERGLAYLDLNLETEQIGIDWQTDCLDNGDHLNLSGAQKVTAYLGAWLAGRFALEDHRGEDAYAEWTRLQKEYELEVDKHEEWNV